MRPHALQKSKPVNMILWYGKPCVLTYTEANAWLGWPRDAQRLVQLREGVHKEGPSIRGRCLTTCSEGARRQLKE